MTWDAVLADPSLCTDATLTSGWSYAVSDCMNYHVLSGAGESGGVFAYYDLTTGMLVAEIVVGRFEPFLSCGGGPSGRFTPPDCSASAFVRPPLCSADGGADGP